MTSIFDWVRGLLGSAAGSVSSLAPSCCGTENVDQNADENFDVPSESEEQNKRKGSILA